MTRLHRLTLHVRWPTDRRLRPEPAPLWHAWLGRILGSHHLPEGLTYWPPRLPRDLHAAHEHDLTVLLRGDLSLARALLRPATPDDGPHLLDTSHAWVTPPEVHADTLTLRLHTPVSILRPPIAAARHIFDDQHLNPEVLLQRIARAAVSQGAAPDLHLPRVTCTHNALSPADVWYGAGKRLRASSGSVTLALPDGTGALAPWLVLAGWVGIGRSTAQGLGRYLLDEAPHPP